jgi:hypothetical protein
MWTASGSSASSRPQWGEVPPATGAMYRYYLARYFKHANDPREEPAPR